MTSPEFAVCDRHTLSAYLGARGIALYAYDTLDSTSTEARRRAGQVTVPAVFLADAQTKGRGRLGRSFFSPAKTGLYLSLLLERSDPVSDVGLTAAAAVAARRAIRRVTGKTVEIKWVNDLYADGKKLAGILCESFCVGEKRFAVVGVGINLYTEDFPEELWEKADSLRPAPGVRHALAAALVTELCALIDGLPCRDFMDEYRAASLATGKRVRFVENGAAQEGIALPVEDDGTLPVRLDDGRIHRLGSGEISLSVATSKENLTEEGNDV